VPIVLPIEVELLIHRPAVVDELWHVCVIVILGQKSLLLVEPCSVQNMFLPGKLTFVAHRTVNGWIMINSYHLLD
jgi:hypothetical protein